MNEASVQSAPDPRWESHHRHRLTERYFGVFSGEEIQSHIHAVSKLNHTHPVQVRVDIQKGNRVRLLIVAFNYEFSFSLICGLLTGLGINIQSGHAFTYSPDIPDSLKEKGSVKDKPLRAYLYRRKIIDEFAGTFETPAPPAAWIREIESRFHSVFNCLENGTPDSITQAKTQVNKEVAAVFSKLKQTRNTQLYPIKIHWEDTPENKTRLKIFSQDTPGFLYAFSTALSYRGISIEQVSIHTSQTHIEDSLDIAGKDGGKITDADEIQKIQLSAILTKHFCHFLDHAPDSYAALIRFEQLCDEILSRPEALEWVNLLSNPTALRGLSRLLGTSDYIWEEFIRLQYEALMPVFRSDSKAHDAYAGFKDRFQTLKKRLKRTQNTDQKIERINRFKDRELFNIDITYILNQQELTVLSENLTRLAESVLTVMTQTLIDDLSQKYGLPESVAHLKSPYAVMGLGKLGSRELGYASDLELQIIYGDAGHTSGPDPISNAEFFEKLARGLKKYIRSKNEGIFKVDLRLRPYGNDGPLAVNLESFCTYYGPGGAAEGYERLALGRLRFIVGDPELGHRLERLRDEFVYETAAIDMDAIWKIRQKQLEEKTASGAYNAKYSAGGLVDIEYALLMMKIWAGRDFSDLRKPELLPSISGLIQRGILSEEEGKMLRECDHFFRQLINALRMLRGSAEDVSLPAYQTKEFDHLAKRMGYISDAYQEADRKLYVDFEEKTAWVRAFLTRHFSAAKAIKTAKGSIADIILLEDLPEVGMYTLLKKRGLKEPEKAVRNIRSIAAKSPDKQKMARLAILAMLELERLPDPDLALNNWERFVDQLENPVLHMQQLLLQPKRLWILLTLFSMSQYFADSLIKNPDAFTWVTDPASLFLKPERQQYSRRIANQLEGVGDDAEFDDEIRRIKREEMIRIGVRDTVLQVGLEPVVEDISYLADAVVTQYYDQIWKEWAKAGKVAPGYETLLESFCILALGKLGGIELNYSSDLDIIGVYDPSLKTCYPDPEKAVDYLRKFMAELSHRISQHTAEGPLYRIDLRLRPYGRSGDLVQSLDQLAVYYQADARFWEKQALLKLRPIAGNLAVGKRYVQLARRMLKELNPDEIRKSIHDMREKSVAQSEKRAKGENIKTGRGGIRDIEFLTQGLCLLNGIVDQGATLPGLRQLAEREVLPQETANQLMAHYESLRKIEHLLQVMEDRQIHAIPVQEEEQWILAKKIWGPAATDTQLREYLAHIRKEVEGHYQSKMEADI